MKHGKSGVASLIAGAAFALASCGNDEDSSNPAISLPLDSVTLSECSGNLSEIRVLEYENEGVVAWHYSDTSYGIEPRQMRIHDGGVSLHVSFPGDWYEAFIISPQGQGSDNVDVTLFDDRVEMSFSPGYARDLIDQHNSSGLWARTVGAGGIADCS